MSTDNQSSEARIARARARRLASQAQKENQPSRLKAYSATALATIIGVFILGKIATDRKACEMRAATSPMLSSVDEALKNAGIEVDDKTSKQWLLCLPF
jgi:hypothetical protein